ncbi:flavin mononucleotide hydrolase 1, chloroplatic-like [Neltuma alba]|uniref:flavin mononucleotide hydrolase 1, chloroplatic-like n=1 Tax=Neltuma alba TaxID=207710 RepID=UPI0010A3E795|nr:flavin mononucleotide hydrolase 1, chloroplatic-like [Prosopis alba]XP_028794155.1 flavin mononucleotide hydrolase 1, chloroplatic-like [Prosopis alba]
MAVVFSLRAPSICSNPRLSLCQNLYLNSNLLKMAKIGGVSSTATPNTDRKLPILLFDMMDTVVRDPFYHDVPAFFGMTLKELMECKHPTAWMEFEKGIIDETELASKFFKDGRPFDLEGLKSCMRSGYSYIEGTEELLLALKQNNYEMHAFTNYPIWYQLIEDKLKLSKYLSWTFCSCTTGKRKPDPEFFMEVLGHLGVDPSNCIFVDDRIKNVEAAIEFGIRGIHFKNSNALREELCLMGIDITANGDHHKLI